MITMSSLTPGAPPRKAARRDRLRRALRADLRLNAEQFGGTVICAVLAVILAALLTDVVVAFVPLWAAGAWYRYGRADSVERSVLRASLGLSRADAVRGRALLVALETAVLLLAGAVGALVARLTGHGGSGVVLVLDGITDAGSAPLGLSAMVGTVWMAATLALSAVVVGRECVTRSPGAVMFVLSILSFLGSALVSWFLLAAVTVGVLVGLGRFAGEGPDPALPLASTLLATGLLWLTACLLLLRSRLHTWIRALDAGGEVSRG